MNQRERLQKLDALGAGCVSDALSMLHAGGWIDGVAPLRSDTHFAGIAFPVSLGRPAPGQKTFSLYEAVARLQSSEVLLAASGGGYCTFGGNMAKCVLHQGGAAIVTDSMGRDKNELSSLGLPVYCAGYSQRPAGLKVILMGESAVFGKDTIYAGDYLVGDECGVAWIRAGRIEEVISLAEKISAIENRLTLLTEQGAATEDVYRAICEKHNLI